MEITCLQMDVLISFYIEGDLSQSLKEKVEEHLQKCPNCRAKYDIIYSLFSEMRSINDTELQKNDICNTSNCTSQNYRVFKNNLSAYIDNELNTEDSIKLKKYTINNKNARKELEDAYNIRKLMNDSFNKTKNQAKNDFSKKIVKQIRENNTKSMNFNALIKVGAAFVMTTLTLSVIIIFCLSFG